MHGSVQHSATVLNKPNLVKQVCFPLSTMHYCTASFYLLVGSLNEKLTPVWMSCYRLYCFKL